MVKLFEIDDYLLINVITLFLLINFNIQIGTIYGIMVLIDWFAYYVALDTKAFTIIPIERDKSNRLMSLVWAMGAYVAFIFIVNIITTRFVVTPPTTSGFEYVSSLIAGTFSATPILYGSTYLKLAVWGIIIPRIESLYFFRTLLQWGVKSAGTVLPANIFNLRAWGIAGFFGVLFAAFHIVAKGIVNNASLFVTFCFGVASVLLVIHFREVIQAIFLHIITNTIATMQQFKMGFFAPDAVGINTEGIMILGGVILVSWFLLFQEIPLVGMVGA